MVKSQSPNVRFLKARANIASIDFKMRTLA